MLRPCKHQLLVIYHSSATKGPLTLMMFDDLCVKNSDFPLRCQTTMGKNGPGNPKRDSCVACACSFSFFLTLVCDEGSPGCGKLFPRAKTEADHCCDLSCWYRIYIELANEVLENLFSSEGKLVTLVTASCSRTFHVTGELRGVIHGHGLQYLTVEVVDGIFHLELAMHGANYHNSFS